MLTKLKLALALTTVLAAGAAGLAVANTAPTTTDSAAAPTSQSVDRAEWKAKRAERHEKMLAKYDLNHNGKLDPSERKLMIDDRAEKRFEKLDTNGDGVISKDEFKAGAEKMGQRMHKRFARRHANRQMRQGQTQGTQGQGSPGNGTTGNQ